MMNITTKARETQPITLVYDSSSRQARKEKSIEAIYSLKDNLKVLQFLQTYPDLIDFLLESYPYIEKYFGKHPKVILDVFTDPELATEQLLASIVTTLPVDEALMSLDKLDDEWILAHLDQIDNRINFHLEAA